MADMTEEAEQLINRNIKLRYHQELSGGSFEVCVDVYVCVHVVATLKQTNKQTNKKTSVINCYTSRHTRQHSKLTTLLSVRAGIQSTLHLCDCLSQQQESRGESTMEQRAH